jgi:hypothetical protein
MKILLVEDVPGGAAATEAELVAAGHTVVGCMPADPSAPCRALEPLGECPLDAGDIDVAVASRSGGDLTASERGALCAARYRVPVVITGSPQRAVSFGPGTHLAGEDLVATCARAARSGAAHEAAIRRQLLMTGVVRPDDVEGDRPRVEFRVTREPHRLRLVIRVPEGDARLPTITKSAAEALRHFDQRSTVIDVVNETT